MADSGKKKKGKNSEKIQKNNNNSSKPFKNWQDFISRDITPEEKVILLRKSPKLFSLDPGVSRPK